MKSDISVCIRPLCFTQICKFISKNRNISHDNVMILETSRKPYHVSLIYLSKTILTMLFLRFCNFLSLQSVFLYVCDYFCTERISPEDVTNKQIIVRINLHNNRYVRTFQMSGFNMVWCEQTKKNTFKQLNVEGSRYVKGSCLQSLSTVKVACVMEIRDSITNSKTIIPQWFVVLVLLIF